MPLQPQQKQDLRGSIGDAEKRLVQAQEALGQAIESLDQDDPEGARSWLDEAERRIAAAARDAHTTSHALVAARDREQS